MDAGPAPVIELEAWTLPPDPRAHRGGVWTGSPEPLPAATAGELHKLALARAAVDAARAAGTLRRGIDEELGRLSPAERDALKRQRGADLPPAELIPDPAAGVGEVGPLREPGPPGLTADERDRRDRWTPADALPGQTEEVPE